MINREAHDASRAGRLRDLLHDCVASADLEQTACLIEAAWLLPRLRDRQHYDAMVNCGAYESAAALMFGADRPYLVSRGAHGVCLASAMFEGGEEVTVEAATPALAMLAAHVAALLAEESRPSPARLPKLSASTARLH